MQAFFDIALGVPTVFFTVPLAFAAGYWLLAMLGAVDVEILDGAESVSEGLEGALDGVDDALEGAVEAGQGASEVADGAASGGVLVALLSVLRVGKVPVTVSLSSFVFWGWIMGFLLTWMYRGWGAHLVSHLLFSVGAMALATGIALLLTNLSVRPLEPVFRTAPGKVRAHLIGESCEITTGRVDAAFGQATAQLGGDDMVFQVRCDRVGNGLLKGQRALIVHYDARREAYVVEPLTPDAPNADRASAGAARRHQPEKEG